jgi:hypothetical protein
MGDRMDIDWTARRGNITKSRPAAYSRPYRYRSYAPRRRVYYYDQYGNRRWRYAYSRSQHRPLERDYIPSRPRPSLERSGRGSGSSVSPYARAASYRLFRSRF